MSQTSTFSRRQFVASAASAVALAALPIPAETETPKTKGRSVTKLMPYLLFDGKCREAMEFYKSVFGGELSLTKVKDSPAAAQLQPFQQERVLNAHLQSDVVEISASDWLVVSRTPTPGNTVCLFLTGGKFQDLKSLFDKLSQGANVTDPLKEVFFGVYGALNDQFGVRWMFQTNNGKS